MPGDLYTYDDATPSKWTVTVNGTPVSANLSNGYLRVDREWKSGDVVDLNLPMPVRRVAASSKVSTNVGLVALERGPVVYAFEGIDNDGSVFDLVLPSSSGAKPIYETNLLGGVVALQITGGKRVIRKDGQAMEKPAQLTAIPYAMWNNRGNSPMAVWLGRDARHVRPSAEPTLATKAKVTVSFSRKGMDPSRINDQQMPRNATDGFAANFDFWPHNGGSEWVAYEWEKPVTVSKAKVSWFDDTASGGGCGLPKAWRIAYQDANGNWKPVQTRSAYTIRRAEPVNVEFAKISTKSLRLEIELKDGISAGLYEWEVTSD